MIRIGNPFQLLFLDATRLIFARIRRFFLFYFRYSFFRVVNFDILFYISSVFLLSHRVAFVFCNSFYKIAFYLIIRCFNLTFKKGSFYINFFYFQNSFSCILVGNIIQDLLPGPINFIR